MGHPAEKPDRATYADLLAVPPSKVAEIIHGVLHVFPRPAPRHANAATALTGKLSGPFQFGDDGPGGWWIIAEPEIHFPAPDAPGEIDAVVPDLAGWRRERMPELPEAAYFSLPPDWICEVLSPSTEAHDRSDKTQIYAREGVCWAWLVDPVARTLEAYVLERGQWRGPDVYGGDAQVRAMPFEAIELPLARLWAQAPVTR